MTITAKNYAAQCIEYMENESLFNAERLFNHKNNKNKDINKFNSYKEQIELTCKGILESVKFVIPDGGFILKDNLKGIIGNKINLPFDKITIEFYDNSTNIRHVIFAVQDNENIYYYSFYGKDKKYGISPFVVKVDKEKWNDGNINISGKIKLRCEVVLWNEFLNYGDKIDGLMESSRNELMPILEFIEALSCTNVEQTIHQEASQKNAQRIKSGKLPIYETKVLTIKASEPKNNKQGLSTGTHASPRQHLRRGHIRRIETGNIWVNACVVGSKENGIINKSYNVR